MVSIIVPFAVKHNNDVNLHNWPNQDLGYSIYNTIQCIKNINNVLDIEKEIILVDNTNNFPNIKIPNLKIVKGWQYLTESEIKSKKNFDKYKINNFKNLSMWVSMAYNIGIENAKGDYIILQHNDIHYHTNLIPNLIHNLEFHSYGYISADYKKLSISGYLGNKETIDNIIDDIQVGYEDGGFIKTKYLGFADCYFFLCKKEFFDDYHVDWEYGDSNHGATIKCLNKDIPFLHIGPYYDNPNFPTKNTMRTYEFNNKNFITHLKGGFSENKLAYRRYDNKIPYTDEIFNYINLINGSTHNIST